MDTWAAWAVPGKSLCIQCAGGRGIGMAQSKEAMNGNGDGKPFYDRRITILCLGTFLMDFTSHIASQVSVDRCRRRAVPAVPAVRARVCGACGLELTRCIAGDAGLRHFDAWREYGGSCCAHQLLHRNRRRRGVSHQPVARCVRAVHGSARRIAPARYPAGSLVAPPLTSVPLAGKLSDAYGRMLPLLLCPLLNAVARGTPPVLGLSKAKLMFGRGTAGGARAAYLMAVNAAIADMVPAEERTAVFGKLGAFVQASFMVGMFSAGEVTKRYSPKVRLTNTCSLAAHFLIQI